MTKKDRAENAVKALKELYPDVRCTLEYSSPVELLIATQLSAQCTDARVNIVTKTLFKKYPDCEAFANADYDELCEDIRSTGFFRNKAKNIIECCKKIISDYNGEVPDTMEKLLTLAGTGRKTANLVLGDIFKKPAVVVDTHCIRLSNRIGLTKNSLPEKIEQDLKNLIPPDEQLDFCHRLVAHGRNICTARSPKCEECPLNNLCKEYESKGAKK
ncbi:MAG: endonuclease III [Clostridia bacterium]|nr:endonuclease III [Clostridia bacterium]